MIMEEFESAIPELEKEEDLIAAAKKIAKALSSKKSLTEEARKILSDLGSQLSTISISIPSESKAESVEISETVCDEIEKLLDSVQDKIMSWESDHSMIWESSFEEGFEYLKAADEAQRLAERLEGLCSSETGCDDRDRDQKFDLHRRACDVLQTVMDRLEDEFRHMLVHHRQPFEPELVLFRSSEDDNLLEEGSINSFGDDSIEDSINRDSLSRGADELVDLVSPEVVPELKNIANLMFRAKYDRECSHAYSSLRKDALDECLFGLEVEKLSIEDVLKTEWGVLNSKIKKWIRAMKIFVRVYLASEKWLCDQIFGELGHVSLVCFVESSKTSILQLLNFGEAMSVGPQQPEKLCRVLDMYEVLEDLVLDIEALYDGQAGSVIVEECREVLGRLGDCVRATFIEFRNAIASNHSNNSVSGGGIHPLTRYVMNYLRLLTDYGETLNSLFKDPDEDDRGASGSPDMSPTKKDEDHMSFSAMARRFESVATALERNLEDKSLLYKDVSLQHLFLMNNIHYMAQKVKGPELRPIFGDRWIRKHNGKFQQHAIDYQRASWGSIISLLKEEGVQNPISNSLSKNHLKERFRSFYLAFEEIYRTQTGWTIPDAELREDVRISTSLNVIQAYRIFEGRHFNHISERHIKYSADDLQRCLLDLFEGSPKSLQSTCRR